MIDIFLSVPIELRIILLFGIVIFLLEFIKLCCLKFVRKEDNKEDNNAKKGHN